MQYSLSYASLKMPIFMQYNRGWKYGCISPWLKSVMLKGLYSSVKTDSAWSLAYGFLNNLSIAVQIADNITKQLSCFNAVHIRRNDFLLQRHEVTENQLNTLEELAFE